MRYTRQLANLPCELSMMYFATLRLQSRISSTFRSPRSALQTLATTVFQEELICRSPESYDPSLFSVQTILPFFQMALMAPTLQWLSLYAMYENTSTGARPAALIASSNAGHLCSGSFGMLYCGSRIGIAGTMSVGNPIAWRASMCSRRVIGP